MQRWKSRSGKSQREKSRSEKIRDGESQKRQDAGARKGREVAIHCVFPMICDSGGSKSNLAKAAGAEPAGQMRDEKVRAVVARSTCASQKGKNTSRSEHFWKLSCRKSARRCGAKHISKSKVSKTHSLRPVLEVETSKKCMPLWRDTFPSQKCQKPTVSDQFWKLRPRKNACRCGAKHISKPKCTKHARFRPVLEVETSKKCMPLWRDTFPSQKCQKPTVSDQFWKLRPRKNARRCGAKHISKPKCTKHARFRPVLEVETSKKCTPLWREAHFQAKMYKTRQVQTSFGS